MLIAAVGMHLYPWPNTPRWPSLDSTHSRAAQNITGGGVSGGPPSCMCVCDPCACPTMLYRGGPLTHLLGCTSRLRLFYDLASNAPSHLIHYIVVDEASLKQLFREIDIDGSGHIDVRGGVCFFGAWWWKG